MKLRKDSGISATAELFIKNAQQHLGYTAEQLGKNKFGARVGYDSQPWAGAFVDVCARAAGIRGPSFTYTAAALAEYFRDGLLFRDPRPGDVAVFNFSSNVGHAADAFGMPHCGIVTDVREFQNSGKFITIEGNTVGSTTHQQKDGVHQKVRHVSEILGFCRPRELVKINIFPKLLSILDNGRTKVESDELKFIEEAAREPQLLRLEKEIRPGDRNKKIEVIQLALATVTDLRGAQPGKWDSSTAAACTRYQRMIGYVGKDADGLPDSNTLKRLARDTGMFTVA